MVEHVCNLSYLGGGSRGSWSKASPGKSKRPYLKNNKLKTAKGTGCVTQGIESLPGNPQYCSLPSKKREIFAFETLE
jgi:hypothetical protein